MNDVSIILAFSAGLLSFLSPCVLPLVPAYITYLTSSGITSSNNPNKLNTLYRSVGFVIGFSIVFILMGASVSTLGKLIIKNQVLFRKVGGILIIAFGLHTTGLFKMPFLYFEKKLISFDNKVENFLGTVAMGIAFAAGWTPCVGPILSSILIYAGSMATISKGVLLLVFYSLGLSIPFILTALAIDKASSQFNKIKKYLNHISVVSGILLVLMGVLVYTNKVSVLSRYLNFINF